MSVLTTTVSAVSLLFSPEAEEVLRNAHMVHSTTNAYARLVSMLRSIESDTNLITNEAVPLVQFTRPTFMLVTEATPPGPTRVVIVYSIRDGDDSVVIEYLSMA